VQLNVGSQGVVHGRLNGARQVFELTRGSGRFRVEKGTGVFRVDTPAGKITVLGTEFDVELQPGMKRGVDDMNAKTALTLVVAVVVGSVQVDWTGGHVTLSNGQRQAFAAEAGDREGEGRRAREGDRDREGEGDRAREGERDRSRGVTLTGRVVATIGPVPGDGGRVVEGLKGVKLVTEEAAYPVKLNRNGRKLAQRFNGKVTTVRGALIRQDAGPVLVVYSVPEGEGRVHREGEGRDAEGERRAPEAGKRDREGEGGERSGDGADRRRREGGDRDGEGEVRLRIRRDGDREGDGGVRRHEGGERDGDGVNRRPREGGDRDGEGEVRLRIRRDGDREREGHRHGEGDRVREGEEKSLQPPKADATF
jgi:hypothetical protein